LFDQSHSASDEHIDLMLTQQPQSQKRKDIEQKCFGLNSMLHNVVKWKGYTATTTKKTLMFMVQTSQSKSTSGRHSRPSINGKKQIHIWMVSLLTGFQ
jgi:hypothetical protein